MLSAPGQNLVIQVTRLNRVKVVHEWLNRLKPLTPRKRVEILAEQRAPLGFLRLEETKLGK